jgi:hypothetical protein
MTAAAPLAFADLLARAVTEPGRIHEAYTAFHRFSIGNQLLALFECSARGIEPGPLATFPAWKEKGRHVRKGEKAITLCMPVTCKRTPASDDDPDAPQTFTRFIYRPRWFVLAQTDGEPLTAELAPAWDRAAALASLNIEEIPFDHMDGNCQGFARGRAIAVSPLAAFPFKTLFHEAAHVLLGHTAEADQTDGEQIPERSAARIFKTADQILRAGTTNTADETGGDL